MKVRIEIVEAVWERQTAYITLSDEEVALIKANYGLDAGGVEAYLIEHMDSWSDTVDIQFLDTVADKDREYSTVILDEA